MSTANGNFPTFDDSHFVSITDNDILEADQAFIVDEAHRTSNREFKYVNEAVTIKHQYLDAADAKPLASIGKLKVFSASMVGVLFGEIAHLVADGSGAEDTLANLITTNIGPMGEDPVIRALAENGVMGLFAIPAFMVGFRLFTKLDKGFIEPNRRKKALRDVIQEEITAIEQTLEQAEKRVEHYHNSSATNMGLDDETYHEEIMELGDEIAIAEKQKEALEKQMQRSWAERAWENTGYALRIGLVSAGTLLTSANIFSWSFTNTIKDFAVADYAEYNEREVVAEYRDALEAAQNRVDNLIQNKNDLATQLANVSGANVVLSTAEQTRVDAIDSTLQTIQGQIADLNTEIREKKTLKAEQDRIAFCEINRCEDANGNVTVAGQGPKYNAAIAAASEYQQQITDLEAQEQNLTTQREQANAERERITSDAAQRADANRTEIAAQRQSIETQMASLDNDIADARKLRNAALNPQLAAKEDPRYRTYQGNMWERLTYLKVYLQDEDTPAVTTYVSLGAMGFITVLDSLVFLNNSATPITPSEHNAVRAERAITRRRNDAATLDAARDQALQEHNDSVVTFMESRRGKHINEENQKTQDRAKVEQLLRDAESEAKLEKLKAELGLETEATTSRLEIARKQNQSAERLAVIAAVEDLKGGIDEQTFDALFQQAYGDASHKKDMSGSPNGPNPEEFAEQLIWTLFTYNLHKDRGGKLDSFQPIQYDIPAGIGDLGDMLAYLDGNASAPKEPELARG